MKGYICDRCGVTGEARFDARDGEFHPEGWIAVSIGIDVRHLCPRCVNEFAEFMSGTTVRFLYAESMYELCTTHQGIVEPGSADCDEVPFGDNEECLPVALFTRARSS